MKNILLRIDLETINEIEALAKGQERSTNKQIVFMIKRYLQSPFLGASNEV